MFRNTFIQGTILGSVLFVSGCATPGIEFQEQRPILRLQSVTAISTTIGSNEDQIYLQFSDGSRYPDNNYVIRSGDTWVPEGIVLDTTVAGSVSLFESDSLSSDDLIGIYEYNRTEAGTYTQTMTGDGSRYELIWVVTVE
ncbi:hypothetical protein [Hyphobacterium indicum]|uniref:hypothetical protein n=1 Tax=Hyphobacterium indicum TaxID=2162714 RepID=UPI000D658A8A|nr:hypothetical protein [Hyphobacterium indicum]